MCHDFSMILTAKRIYYYPGIASHTNILRKIGLKDILNPPNFVKLEFIPDWTDYNDIEKWKLVVDQDILPDWFSQADALREAKKIARKIIDNGEWKLGGGLDLTGCTGLRKLPEGLKVGGWLWLRGCTGLTKKYITQLKKKYMVL